MLHQNAPRARLAVLHLTDCPIDPFVCVPLKLGVRSPTGGSRIGGSPGTVRRVTSDER
jgi:hypothetical protein